MNRRQLGVAALYLNLTWQHVYPPHIDHPVSYIDFLGLSVC
jgi:hypothetical protein